MICPSCDRMCSWVGRHNRVDWYGCVDGCGRRWEGPPPVCVDFMDNETTEEKEQAA